MKNLIVDPMTGDMFYLDEEANLSLVPEKNNIRGGQTPPFYYTNIFAILMIHYILNRIM